MALDLVKTEGGKKVAWILTEKRRSGFQANGERIIKNALDKQFGAVVAKIESSGILNPEYAEIITPEPIQKAYSQLYQMVGVEFAMSVVRTFKSEKIKDDELSRIIRDFMTSFVKTRTGERIAGVTNTVREKIKEIVSTVASEGLGIPEAGKQIRQQWTDVSKARSRVIARTEIISASNVGQVAGAKAVGLPMQKEWIATRDGNVRESHAFADGQTKPLDNDFFVGGENLSFPGDPKGSPDNVIMCRCTVGFKVI